MPFRVALHQDLASPWVKEYEALKDEETGFEPFFGVKQGDTHPDSDLDGFFKAKLMHLYFMNWGIFGKIGEESICEHIMYTKYISHTHTHIYIYNKYMIIMCHFFAGSV